MRKICCNRGKIAALCVICVLFAAGCGKQNETQYVPQYDPAGEGSLEVEGVCYVMVKEQDYEKGKYWTPIDASQKWIGMEQGRRLMQYESDENRLLLFEREKAGLLAGCSISMQQQYYYFVQENVNMGLPELEKIQSVQVGDPQKEQYPVCIDQDAIQALHEALTAEAVAACSGAERRWRIDINVNEPCMEGWRCRVFVFACPHGNYYLCVNGEGLDNEYRGITKELLTRLSGGRIE